MAEKPVLNDEEEAFVLAQLRIRYDELGRENFDRHVEAFVRLTERVKSERTN